MECIESMRATQLVENDLFHKTFVPTVCVFVCVHALGCNIKYITNYRVWSKTFEKHCSKHNQTSLCPRYIRKYHDLIHQNYLITC